MLCVIVSLTYFRPLVRAAKTNARIRLSTVLVFPRVVTTAYSVWFLYLTEGLYVTHSCSRFLPMTLSDCCYASMSVSTTCMIDDCFSRWCFEGYFSKTPAATGEQSDLTKSGPRLRRILGLKRPGVNFYATVFTVMRSVYSVRESSPSTNTLSCNIHRGHMTQAVSDRVVIRLSGASMKQTIERNASPLGLAEQSK